eukprot:921485-Prorocentrum_minimum.AAC.1
MAVCRQGIHVECSMEHSECRALNGIRVSTVDDCRLLNCSRRPFWPSTPGLGARLEVGAPGVRRAAGPACGRPRCAPPRAPPPAASPPPPSP